MNVRGKEDPYLKIGETNDRSVKGSSDYVWALRDINFKIEQGDVVGIIGRNGAGKSTLLKLLSKVTGPTTGQIRARGRIGSLLEVGTGFHPEMTGRENIFMNGAILGMTKPEIARKLDEIVDFSGCERYLDTPVKRYSSGMMVRLGFAVAAHLDPEILVVDEVLAVGDAEFQKKAIGKMKDVSQGEGRTVLFVSHNMAAVKNLCNRGVVLEKGRISYVGGIYDAVNEYVANGVSAGSVFFKDLTTAPGNEKIRIKSFQLSPIHGERIDVVSGIHVVLEFMNYQPNIMMDASCHLCTAENLIVFHNTALFTPNNDSKVGLYRLEYDIPPHLLNSGRYYFKIFFGESQRYVIWGDYIHYFDVEDVKTLEGNLLATPPGVIRPRFDFKKEFLG